MSASGELQEFVIAALKTDAAVSTLVGVKVYDRRPATLSPPCITLGASSFIPDDADCITGRLETLQIDIWSVRHGLKQDCRALVDAVKAALHNYAGIGLTINALADLRVTLARVDDDPDGLTAHGIVQIEAAIEEA